jgi:diguanylate cyclase (GGDEF)-like protein
MISFPSSLRLLLVEDSTPDAELAAELLSDAMPDVQVTVVASLLEAVRTVSRLHFDVALVDLSLPDAEGLEPVLALRAARRDLALVVLTGLDADVVVHRALSEGAQDYLLKSDLSGPSLVRAVRNAVSRARGEEELRSSRAYAQSVLDSIEAPTCALDPSGVIVATNVAWERFTLDNGGSPAECGLGTSYLSVCERAAATGDVAAAQVARDLRLVLSTGAGRAEAEYACHGAGELRWFTMRATPTAGGAGAVVTHVNITALKQANDEMGHAALHDPLTGLANRRLLVRDLDRRLRQDDGQAIAVLFIDVDRFKRVNDTYGHTAGDALLMRVAAELTGTVRPDDLVARHGGDEFIVLADVAGEGEAAALARRVQAATCRPVTLDDHAVTISVSTGVIVSQPGSCDTADDILMAVDAAMHSAKERGRGRFEMYGDTLRSQAKVRAALYRDLRDALDRDEFELHYQPIVVPDVGGVHALEALVRWNHPTRGQLPPADFLDVAESTGLIVPLGAKVLTAACVDGQRLHDSGLQLSMSVNLSAKQLSDPETVQAVRSALLVSGFTAGSLILEVTETTMIEDTDRALRSLQAIKALGVQVAVDDFGTGYSSLAYLKRYPVDGIKIDRSFVHDMVGNREDSAIVASLIALARDLDLWVVAEGVESTEELDHLRAMDCELVQGFVFAHAVPAGQVEALVHRLASHKAVRLPDQRHSEDCAGCGRRSGDRVVDLT